jgi:adenylosuccinate lyase
MIPRYSRPEMAAIWDPQTRFRIWFEIEAQANRPPLRSPGFDPGMANLAICGYLAIFPPDGIPRPQ